MIKPKVKIQIISFRVYACVNMVLTNKLRANCGLPPNKSPAKKTIPKLNQSVSVILFTLLLTPVLVQCASAVRRNNSDNNVLPRKFATNLSHNKDDGISANSVIGAGGMIQSSNKNCNYNILNINTAFNYIYTISFPIIRTFN